MDSNYLVVHLERENNYLFKGIPLNPTNIMYSVKNMIDRSISSQKREIMKKCSSYVDIGISEEEDVLVFFDVAFRATDGKASHGFLMKSKGFILHAGACHGPEAEPRVVFFALVIAKAKGFPKVCVLPDAKEVVDSLNGCYDWAINPIILDIKDLVSSFVYVRFSFVPRSKMRLLTCLLN